MRATSFFLAVSASTAIAASLDQSFPDRDNGIAVSLSNQAIELGSNTLLAVGKVDKKTPVGSPGPYKTVQILVGRNAANKDIRCKLLDQHGHAIRAMRGANLDTTFSDGGNGEWTFLQQSEVSSIICDPSFEKAAALPAAHDVDEKAAAQAIRVLLGAQTPEMDAAFVIESTGQRNEKEVRGSHEFSKVALAAPAAVQDSLRCQILDGQGKAITVQRGQNVDATFADGGKGAWTFKAPARSTVGKIVCDPAFRKAT
jgi:hypothetical protein